MINMLPLEVSNLGLVICFISIALGGFLRGFLGFGAALLIVPVLSNFLTPIMALVIMYLVEVPTVIYLMPNALKKGSVRIVFPMVLALIFMIPIGFYFVISVEQEIIRIVIALLVIAMVILLASGWKPKGEIKTWTMMLGGGVSGLVNGAAGVGGPPFVSVLMARNDNAETTRANIIITLGCMSLFTTCTQIYYGMVTKELIILSIITFPFYISFTWFGTKYFSKFGNKIFRRGALIMLFSIALVIIFLNI